MENKKLVNLLSADEMRVSIIGISMLLFVIALLIFISIAIYQAYTGVETTIATSGASVLDSIVNTIKALINGLLGINIFNTGANAVQTYASNKITATTTLNTPSNPVNNNYTNDNVKVLTGAEAANI